MGASSHSCSEPPNVTADALRVLTNANRHEPFIFERAGRLCRLRKHKERLRIEPLTADALRGILARVATFAKEVHPRNAGPKLASEPLPPGSLVQDIMSLPEWPFPAIEGIVEAPVLRADGSILAKPGYDPKSGLYYCAGMRLPQIPRNPTPNQLAAALELVKEPIVDFPFVDGNRANALALILTPVVRLLIEGNVPLGLIDKPQQGTGAGLLAKLVCLLATGRRAPMMAAPGDDDEWRKRITAVLMSGATLITIDNLEGTLSSPSLALALTVDIWQDRILGQTEMVEIPQRATWMATGNNIRLGGDMQRRCYWIRMDAETPQPWRGRTFRHPKLLRWVGENRPALLAALLTLARGWIEAGRPTEGVPILGGFEEWCEVVGGILRFAGVEGFLGNLDAMYATADDEAEEWITFLAALEAEYGDRTFTTAELVHDLGLDTFAMPCHRALENCLPAELDEQSGKPNFGSILGAALKARAKRRYAQHRIEQVFKADGKPLKRDNKNVWRVLSDALAAAAD